MAKYLDIFTDFGFKKIFGEEASKGILIDFLNALLPQKAHIKDLTFKNTEKLGLSPVNRNAVYDIYCENEKGEKFIVELQKVKQKYYLDRTILYSTYAISEDAQKGDWDFVLKPVYCISLLDFTLSDNDLNVVQTATLKNEDGIQVYDKLTYIYIELPNFKKAETELHTRLDQWLYFIRNLESFQAIPSIFKDEIVFVEALHKAELAIMSDEDMAKYNISLKQYRNNIANINTATEIGVNKGKMEIARKCLKRGMPVADIADLTGLTEDEIRNITF